MKKNQVLFIVAVSIFIFLLVYSPHFNYSFPFHIDEWHHITEAIKLGEGDYSGGGIGYRIGFHVFLLGLSYIFDLVSIYQFLPAIWAVLTSLVLFYVVYRKTEKNFFIALFAMIFFASLKSNVNIGGLWFFTSLTFAIPFIFLYIFFFTEGIEKQNKKFIFISLGIMAFLIPVHSISVLFALPFLFIYCLFHIDYVKKEWKFFSLFLIIPLLGIMLYSSLNHLSFLKSIGSILEDLQFKKGWGVLEANNSFFEIYSPIGYLLALFGIFFSIFYGKYKEYLSYILWTVVTFVSVIYYKLFDISYLVPYQRTFYYFAISLPLLSAFGLYGLIKIKDNFIECSSIVDKNYAKKFISLIIILIVLFFCFYSYSSLPKATVLYKLIDDKDYSAMLFLKNLPEGRVMAPAEISSTIYVIAGKEPVGAIYFYGNRTESENFFKTGNCSEKNKILKRNKVSYVLSKSAINCTYTSIYGLNNQTDWIYNVQEISGVKSNTTLK
jgi:hypothetical protein